MADDPLSPSEALAAIRALVKTAPSIRMPGDDMVTMKTLDADRVRHILDRCDTSDIEVGIEQRGGPQHYGFERMPPERRVRETWYGPWKKHE